MYPRHFGVTFREQADFDALYQLCQQRDVPFLATSVFVSRVVLRFIRRFVVCDPSSNLLEFKYYFDHRMMY